MACDRESDREFFRTLRSLNLKKNNLGGAERARPGLRALADALVGSSLTEMFLAGNEFSSKDAPMLADVIKDNRDLLHLDISHNKLGTTDCDIGLQADFSGLLVVANALKTNKTLKTITFSGDFDKRERRDYWDNRNSTSVVSMETTMTKADFRGKKLMTTGAAVLAAFLPRCQVLTDLHVGQNRIPAQIMEQLIAVARFEVLCEVPVRALKENSMITELDLAGRSLGMEGAMVVCTHLKSNRTVTSVDLSGNLLRAEGAMYIAETLETNPTVVSLDVSNNYIGNEGAEHIRSALQQSGRRLGSLNLGSNDIPHGQMQAIAMMDRCDVLCAVPVRALRENALTQLDLAGKSSGGEGAVVLSMSLVHNTSLKQLKFGGDHQVSEPVTMETCMTEADFSNKDLLASGATIIAAFLPKCQALTSLNLSINNLVPNYSGGKYDFSGIEALSAALADNTTLLSLDISGNWLKAEGAQHVAKALSTNETLGSLTFSGNLGGSRPATIEKQSVAVDFSGKYLGVAGCVMLAAFLPRCSALACLDISINRILSESRNMIYDDAATSNHEVGDMVEHLGVLCPVAAQWDTGAGRRGYRLHMIHGVLALSKALGSCSRTLTELNVSGNLLSAEWQGRLATHSPEEQGMPTLGS